MTMPASPAPVVAPRRSFSAETWSIFLALGITVFAIIIFLIPNYTPAYDSIRGLPGWIALAYLTAQLWLLLDSALRVRPTSILDAVLAIVPVIAGIVCVVLWLVHFLPLSWFQLNALAMLTATGVVEFVSTLWVRNVVLQRGMSMLPPAP
jgi:hypothetical protein